MIELTVKFVCVTIEMLTKPSKKMSTGQTCNKAKSSGGADFQMKMKKSLKSRTQEQILYPDYRKNFGSEWIKTLHSK